MRPDFSNSILRQKIAEIKALRGGHCVKGGFLNPNYETPKGKDGYNILKQASRYLDNCQEDGVFNIGDFEARTLKTLQNVGFLDGNFNAMKPEKQL